MNIKIRKKVIAGMFHYADEDVSSQYDAHKSVKAIVSYVTDKGFFSICLGQQKMPWSSKKMKLLISPELSGKDATKLVIDNALTQGQSAEAAMYCAKYQENGVIAGQAFLASISEITHFFENQSVINKSLKLIGAAPLVSMLSITAPSPDCVCCCSAFGIRYAETTAHYFVRPVLYTEF